jgi:site-specific DNA-adenine methylase
MTKQDNRLFTNVLGNKSKLIPALRSFEYTSVCEPFAGSAAISLNLPGVEQIVLGETAPILYWGYKLWNLRLWHAIKEAQLGSPEVWETSAQTLISTEHKVLAQMDLEVLLSVVAGAYMYRQTRYGGVCRINKQGKLNVPIAASKVKTATKRLPPVQPPVEAKQLCCKPARLAFLVEQDAYTAIRTWLGNADKLSGYLLVLDPPYYAPGKTPCYPFHNPRSLESWDLTMSCMLEGVKHCVDVLVCGYTHDGHVEFIQDLAATYGYSVLDLGSGELSQLALSKPETDATKPVEESSLQVVTNLPSPPKQQSCVEYNLLLQSQPILDY